MDQKGKWTFAPAYDLTFSASVHGLHSTPIAGESKSPGKKNLLELANEFMIGKAKIILDEVQDTLKNWKNSQNLLGFQCNQRT